MYFPRKNKTNEKTHMKFVSVDAEKEVALHSFMDSNILNSDISLLIVSHRNIFDGCKNHVSNKSQLNGPPLYDHAHLKLHDQFVALIDMKLHAQNQLYTSISF